MSAESYGLLGASPLDSDAAVQQSYRRVALVTHPDKVPAGGLEKEKAEAAFKQLSHAYADILQARRKLSKTAEALSPSSAFRELYGDPGSQSSFAPHTLSSSFAQAPATTANAPRPSAIPSASMPRTSCTMGLDSCASSGISSLASAGTRQHLSPQPSASIDTSSTAQAAAAAAAATPVLGMKRKPPQQQASHMEQALTLSLEELYSGCIKRMLLRRRVFDPATASERPMQEVLEVKVAPGWKEGTRVTFHGKGNYQPGCDPEDLVFVVREALHPRYERRGNDLVTHVSIPLVTALTGGKVDLVLLDQRTMSLPIADIITPHCERIIQGEGMPITRSPGRKGNLIVHFNISFPRQLSPLQKCLIRTAFAEPSEEDDALPTHPHGSSSGSTADAMDEAMAGAAVAAARAIIMSTLQGAVTKTFRMLTG